jgi:hypothetical protein
MVRVVAVPEGLVAKILAGLRTHVLVHGDGGTAQLRFTSAGKVEPAGVVAVTDADDPGLFVNEKFAGVAAPGTDAVTLYGPPAMLFAVNTDDVATPVALQPPAGSETGPSEQEWGRVGGRTKNAPATK